MPSELAVALVLPVLAVALDDVVLTDDDPDDQELPLVEN